MSEQRIHKYPVPAMWTLGPVLIEMPEGAQILHAAEQRNEVMVWALVDPAAPVRRRCVACFVTGPPVALSEGAKHIGTIGDFRGWMVIHVFDLGEEPAERS